MTVLPVIVLKCTKHMVPNVYLSHPKGAILLKCKQWHSSCNHCRR